MNPLAWRREHLVGWFVLSAAGGLIGLLFAWLDSASHTMCSYSLSGAWANCTRVFLTWLAYYQLYWLPVAFGAIIPALGVYAFQLLRSPGSEDTAESTSGSQAKHERPVAVAPLPPGVHRWQPLVIEDNLFGRIWRGQITVSNAFWGVYVLGCVVALIASDVAYAIMHAAGLTNAGVTIASLLFVAYFGFATVAAWNSAWQVRRSPAWLDRIWAYSVLLIVGGLAARTALALADGGLQQVIGLILGLGVLPLLVWLVARYWSAPRVQ